MDKKFVIGIDFGTDSVRSVVIDCFSGEELTGAVSYYPRWKEGRFCQADKNQFRQHPLDYLEGLESSLGEALNKLPRNEIVNIVGLSVDTTGSTPVAVNRDGVPLALCEEFSEDPDGMFVLWKDHTALAEAEEINALCRTWGGDDFTRYIGGVYSSEWFWAKLLHILRKNPAVRKAAYSWVEHCDWISACLTGDTNPLTIKRSRCAAGHKAMWHPAFQGLPAEEFLIQLDPRLAGLRKRLFSETFTSERVMGTLSAQWAKRLGLSPGVVIGVGAFDAHMGAVGGEIEPYLLSKVMGTSTCDMLVAPAAEVGDKLIKGICGQVDGSILPGMVGMEAGQSAFGDIYAWFADLLLWPLKNLQENGLLPGEELSVMDPETLHPRVIAGLSIEAAKIPPCVGDIVAMDWMNGRRTPYANQALKGAITGLNLGSSAPKIFRGLVESTAFGARSIVECFTSQGIPINGVIALGGVAKKSAFVMQVVADVLNIPIKVVRSEQTCALGAAMFAATAAGVFSTVTEAQAQMGNGFEAVYTPKADNVEIYSNLYKKYSSLGSFIDPLWRE